MDHTNHDTRGKYINYYELFIMIDTAIMKQNNPAQTANTIINYSYHMTQWDAKQTISCILYTSLLFYLFIIIMTITINYMIRQDPGLAPSP